MHTSSPSHGRSLMWLIAQYEKALFKAQKMKHIHLRVVNRSFHSLFGFRNSAGRVVIDAEAMGRNNVTCVTERQACVMYITVSCDYTSARPFLD